MFCRKALILTVFSLLVVSTLMATTTPNPSAAVQQMNQMPLAFTKNMGQWDERVLFRANSGGATMWFTKEGVTYQFTRDVRGDTWRVPDLLIANYSTYLPFTHLLKLTYKLSSQSLAISAVAKRNYLISVWEVSCERTRS